MMESQADLAARNAVVSSLDGELGPQAARYLVASLLALAADLVVYAVLLRLLLAPTLAGALGYGAGLVLHYALSTVWVFPDPSRQRGGLATFVKFAATGLIGLAMTAAIIGALTGFGLAGAYAAKLIAIVVSYLVVFALRRLYVFSSRS